MGYSDKHLLEIKTENVKNVKITAFNLVHVDMSHTSMKITLHNKEIYEE